MAQSVEELTHSPADSEAPVVDKEAYQTDFSVTNRLLLPFNGNLAPVHLPSITLSYRNGAGGSFQQNHAVGPVSSLPGWQSLLPNDQGGISAKNYAQPGWRNVPNASLSQGGQPPTIYQPVGYGGSSSYHPTHPTQSPDSSTSVITFGGKDYKENSEPGTSLTSGDKDAIKKYCQQVTNTEVDDSSDDSDDSSNHSSHGEAESIDEPKKPKRTRTAFSNLQLDQLELAFSRSHYPDVFTREDLSNKLSIKEDRIQVWFQNRRARYRKQERTGSISLRSKYRQKRLQKLQQSQVAAATMTGTGMYASYYPSGGSQAMIASPQSVSPYMPGFAFPPNYIPNTLAGGGGNSSGAGNIDGTIPTTVASPGYIPGFKGSIPIPASYMAMGLNQNGGGSVSAYGPAYGSAPQSIIATPVTQK